MQLTTTLNKIRQHNPCSDGWRKLLKYLGKTTADDEPLPFGVILDSNGLEEELSTAQAAAEAAAREIAWATESAAWDAAWVAQKSAAWAAALAAAKTTQDAVGDDAWVAREAARAAQAAKFREMVGGR